MARDSVFFIARSRFSQVKKNMHMHLPSCKCCFNTCYTEFSLEIMYYFSSEAKTLVVDEESCGQSEN
jgi:hypothetical protein